MITFLNRVRLLADSSGEAAAKAREALRAAGIPFAMRTVQNHTALGKAIHSGMGMSAYRGGMPASSFSDRLSYVYIVYVRKRDLKKAKETCRLG